MATRDRAARNRRVTMKDIRGFLEASTKESLVELIVDHAKHDDALRQRLVLETAKSSPHGLNVEAYRSALDDAIDPDGFVDYRRAQDYARRIHEVIDSTDQLLSSGHAEMVIELCEHALHGLEAALDSVDDSNGVVGEIVRRVQALHFAACKSAPPAPVALARRLFAWELSSPWEIFHDAASTYADVLGESGLATYRELAEQVWARVPALGPNERDALGFSDRYRITRIMETLATIAGDTDELIAIKKRDLSLPYHHLQLAELYEQQGKHHLAIEWAERGMRAFPERTDHRLSDFLADAYHRAKRFTDEMSVAWRAFQESPRFENYRDLERRAVRLHQRHEWRERALALMRGGGVRGPATALGRRSDRSELVRVFLAESDVESAWREAIEGGCSGDLWLKLARLRSETHPEDAIGVYRKTVTALIDRKDNNAYREAVALLKEIRELMNGLNRADEFAAYITAVRMQHKAKRNFAAMVDHAKLRP
jgi:uncharacterized Zn finger protein